MQNILTASYFLLLLLIAVIGVYNWAYPSRVRKTEEELRIRLPGGLRALLTANRFLSVLVFLIIIFIIIRIFLFTP